MNTKKIIKAQFNRQSRRFSEWPVTRNQEYMQRYFDFIGISADDVVLDVACGTGEFSVFTAKKAKRVHGIDISKGMINIAVKQAKANCLSNTKFICHDVEHLPCESNSFTVVVCKSAFHHMKNHGNVFREMIRCCRKGGRLSIQDIVSYDNRKINDFFEKIEKQIDISHNASLSKDMYLRMYSRNDIEIIRSFDVDVELNFSEYLGHAHQSKSSIKRINDLLEYGLEDEEISEFFIMKKEELFFKRKVFLILGQKKQ